MSWKEYQEKLGVRHSFEQFGCEDFWVVLRRLDSFPYGEVKESKATPIDIDELTKSPEKAEGIRREVEEQLLDCILDWYVTDPDVPEGGSDEDKAKSMPVPTKEDLASLNKLPAEFIAAMFIWLREDSDLAKRVPKGTGTPSGRR